MPLLDMMKQTLVVDGSSKLTEAQLQEQALAEQVAMRRRMRGYSPEEMLRTRDAVRFEKLDQSTFAGLDPNTIMQTLGAAAEAEDFDQNTDKFNASMARARQAEEDYLREMERNHGRPAGTYLNMSAADVQPEMPAMGGFEGNHPEYLQSPVAPAAPYGHTAPMLGDREVGPDGRDRYVGNRPLAVYDHDPLLIDADEVPFRERLFPQTY
jgi:hypothetical protein